VSGETEQQVSGWTTDTVKALLEIEIGHVKDLLKEAIAERDKALSLQLTEYLRRLDQLNHAHEQAREKERDFIGREAFETFVLRTGDDFKTLRGEIRVTSDAVSASKQAAAEALATALAEQNRTNETRFGKIENVQAKMVGGLILCTVFVPAVTAMVVYLLTRHALPTK
jgi:hypothetical protein